MKTMKTMKTMTVIGLLALALGAVSGQAQSFNEMQREVSRQGRQKELSRNHWEAEERYEAWRDPIGTALRKESGDRAFKMGEEVQKRRNAYVQAQLAAIRTNAATAGIRRQQQAAELREKRAQAALENQPKREAWLAARAERKAEAAKLP